MKISCPKCNASGSIPDHEVPESGRFISCPRCNEGFTVTKPRAGNDVYLVDTCPSCGFSTFGDETFGTCPKCGSSNTTKSGFCEGWEINCRDCGERIASGTD